MAEYIKREDVLTIIKASIFDLEYSGENDELQEEIKTIPAADVVKVVRCGECKYLDYDGELFCGYFQRGIEGKDFFCAHGERKNYG